MRVLVDDFRLLSIVCASGTYLLAAGRISCCAVLRCAVVCGMLFAGGNWIAAALDENGRQYIIDQAGDLYYDTGNPDIGIYAVSV